MTNRHLIILILLTLAFIFSIASGLGLILLGQRPGSTIVGILVLLTALGIGVQLGEEIRKAAYRDASGLDRSSPSNQRSDEPITNMHFVWRILGAVCVLLLAAMITIVLRNVFAVTFEVAVVIGAIFSGIGILILLYGEQEFRRKR
jgi:hypothetical protein